MRGDLEYGKKFQRIARYRTGAPTDEEPLLEVQTMSMKQLETFLAKASGNDDIRRELDQCDGDTICVAKVGLRHGHKFSAANYSRWQREHG